MTDKITELILHDIQTSLLGPGTWLKQIYLEQRYRCGRPEVRRALDRLTQKRLMVHFRPQARCDDRCGRHADGERLQMVMTRHIRQQDRYDR
ncbi:hypothetical protein [Sodalis sp.]|uniref:hypothetical protein n=1 Tax=Sodalis sp. (in: enterobacteria) TaxID=1898979 RepID=UPI0038733896